MESMLRPQESIHCAILSSSRSGRNALVSARLPKVNFIEWTERRKVRKPIAVGDGDKEAHEEIVNNGQILCQFQEKMTGVFGGERTPKKPCVSDYLIRAVFHGQSCITN